MLVDLVIGKLDRCVAVQAKVIYSSFVLCLMILVYYAAFYIVTLDP